MTNPAIKDTGEAPAPEELSLIDQGQMGTSSEPVSHEYIYKCSMCGKGSKMHELKQGCMIRCPICDGVHFIIEKE